MAPLNDGGSSSSGEDSPVVTKLKEFDDKYLALEREYEQAMAKLTAEYTEKQRPLLEARAEKLSQSTGTGTGGTPALSGFWLKCMQNHPELSESIQEWDEPVLEYLTDISSTPRDVNDSNKGYKLTFKFAENPYFSNTEVWKEYETEEGSPYSGEMVTKGTRCSPIEWKPGKDVTVAKAVKKAKGKKPQPKSKEPKEEARQSFFREFFRDLYPGCPLFEDSEMEGLFGESAMAGSMKQAYHFILAQDHERGDAFKDYLIPFAVRWYTGEAVPEGADDSDDEDDEDDEDISDDDEEEESEEEGGQAMPKKPTEECKQQ